MDRSFRDKDRRPKEMHDAVCSNCGKDCKVPFKPKNSKPIYCSECFEDVERKRDEGDFSDIKSSRGGRFSTRGKQKSDGELLLQLKEQMCGMSAKMDKILRILDPGSN